MPSQRPILLVEDNPDDEALTLRALQRNKIECPVIVAHDGVEAIDCLFGNAAHPLPALILLDLKLPRVDGLEVLRRIRAHPRTRMLPVVILTTSNERQDVIESYSRGANSYVRKPVDFDFFITAIGQLTHYWLTLNEPVEAPET
jgi:CheY-like chemotaxis protein